MARKKEAHGGGHGWFVTFADLMGLLVSFFVMLVAFSSQDQQKLQIVACAMRLARKTTCAIPASSRSTACRRGPSSRTRRTFGRKIRQPRRRPTKTVTIAR